MKRVPKAIYLTADETEEQIREREDDARLMPPDSPEHRAIMKEIAQLRMYAEAKRWISSPGLQPGTSSRNID